jgi:hypothetical protein
MQRDERRRGSVRIILMTVLLTLALVGVTFGLTRAEAAADWIWLLGPHQ